MRIAYCIPSCHKSGGMERVLSIKANYLADVLGWSVTIITTEQWEGARHFVFSDKIHFVCMDVNYSQDVGVLSVIANRSKRKRDHRRKLSSFLGKEKFDICVSMFCHEMTFLASIPDGSKKVLELHFCREFRYLDQLYNGKGLISRFMGCLQTRIERRAIKNYDAFVVLSKEDAANWGDAYKCTVISNPVEESCAGEPDYSAKHAVAVGRLCPQKGFDLLMDVWAGLPESYIKEWRLAIYGSGNQEELKQRISILGLEDHVQLCGVTDDIPAVLRKASVFCFSSRYEGFSMALAEAMAAGLPPVSFCCPSGPSDIIEHGVNGYCVPVGDVAGFRRCLEGLMRSESLRKERGRAAQTYIHANYSLDKIMKQWVELFNQLTQCC